MDHQQARRRKLSGVCPPNWLDAGKIGFIAASIATWYYRTGLGIVLSWTIGAALLSGLGLALLLRRKVE